jgi:hypothetical protein
VLTSARAAIVTVPVTNPEPTGSSGLEEAINTVNAGDPDDIYVIEIDLDGGADTISVLSELPAITQRAVIVRGTRSRQQGLYTITGRDAENRDAGTLMRMAREDTDSGDALLYSIENLILEKSGFQCARMTANTVSVVNSVFRECLQPGTGLSALFIEGSGSVRQSDFIGNRSACGFSVCSGGAIEAQGARLTIESSYFGQNSALGGAQPIFGGAVVAREGIEISDSYFEENRAGGSGDSFAFGGAVSVIGSALIYRSSFHANKANGDDPGLGAGGAIHHEPVAANNGRLMRIWNVEFDSNEANGNGQGGAINQAAFSGPGRGDDPPRLDIRNSTFVNNRASDSGADLVIESDQAVEEIHNTIFASWTGSPSCVKGDGSGPLNGDYNLLAAASSCNVSGITVDNVRFGGLRRLGRLRVNNLLPDSPAIDQGSPLASDFGNPSTCRPTDIIGTERPQAGPGPSEPFCDIGALEFVEDGLFGDRFQQ